MLTCYDGADKIGCHTDPIREPFFWAMGVGTVLWHGGGFFLLALALRELPALRVRGGDERVLGVMPLMDVALVHHGDDRVASRDRDGIGKLGVRRGVRRGADGVIRRLRRIGHGREQTKAAVPGDLCSEDRTRTRHLETPTRAPELHMVMTL